MFNTRLNHNNIIYLDMDNCVRKDCENLVNDSNNIEFKNMCKILFDNYSDRIFYPTLSRCFTNISVIIIRLIKIYNPLLYTVLENFFSKQSNYYILDFLIEYFGLDIETYENEIVPFMGNMLSIFDSVYDSEIQNQMLKITKINTLDELDIFYVKNLYEIINEKYSFFLFLV